MKNLNSFKAITHAIEGERERQIELIGRRKEVIQETRAGTITKNPPCDAF